MSVATRRITRLRSYVPVVQTLEQRRLLSAGDPDFSFAGDGTASIDLPGSSNEIANATLVQSDGKIIVAGRATVGTETDFFVARLNASGSFDTSFGGGDGLILIDFQVNDEAMDIALQSDGKIVVVGTSSSGSGSNARKFAIARLTSTGILDTSFSGDGKILVDFGINADAQAVATDGTSIYIGGFKDLGATGQFALVKLTSAGAEDTTYSTDGEVFFGFGGNNDSRCYDIAVDSSHRVVMVGYDESLVGNTARNFAYARVGTNALLDTSFSGDGLAVTDFASEDDEARAVGIDSSGSIVVGGFSPGTGGTDFTATRLSEAGALDSSFNGDGTFRLNLGGVEAVDDLAIHPDGDITLSGMTSAGGFQAALVRLSAANGNLSTSFGDGGDGIQFMDFGGIDDGFAIALDPRDLRAVVAGTDGFGRLAVGRLHDLIDQNYSGATTTNQFDTLIQLPDGKLLTRDGNTIRRRLTDGSTDPTFTAITLNGTNVRDMAVDGLGRIVVGGNHSASPSTVGVLHRYLSDGSPDLSFSGDGEMSFSYSSPSNPTTVNAIAIDSLNRVVAVGYVDSSVATVDDVAVARITAAGTLDTSFNGDGTNVFPLTPNYDEAKDVVIQTDGKIIVVGNDRFNAFALRLDSDGSRDLSYSSTGLKDFDLGFGTFNVALCAVIDSGNRLVIGGYSVPDIGPQIEESFVVRLTSSGAFDSTFGGGDGAVTFQALAGGEVAAGVAVDDAGRIVTLSMAFPDTASDDYRVLVRRLLTNGSNDATFAGDGEWMAPFPPIAGTGSFSSVPVILGGGAIYVAGGEVLRLNVNPAITDFSFIFDTVPQRLEVRFNDDVGDSLADTDIVIRNTTTTAIVAASFYDVTSFDSLTNTATISFANSTGFILSDGFYTATFSNTGISNRQNMLLQGDRVGDFFFLNADATQDRQIDTLDFNILAGNFGSSGRTFTRGNFNYDAAGQVNSLDFNIFLAHYGKSFPAAAAIGTLSVGAAPPIFSAMRVEEDHPAAILTV